MEFEASDQAQVGRVNQVHGDYYEGVLPQVPVIPQFVRVPTRNPVFVGREDDLAQLGRSATTVITQAAVGTGGVGKTTLAAEFCHRHRDEIDVVRWLVAADRTALIASYRNIAKWLSLDVDALDDDEAIARIRHWFEHTECSWLLVFDNAEHPDDLEDLIPTRGNGRVLITSRRRDWPNALALEVLDKADAVTLLCQVAERQPSPEAESLVDHLGCLALAVDQAAAFCRETGWSFEDYQQDLVLRPEEVDSTLDMVWQRSTDRADADCPGAREILDVLAYFAPDDIPVSLVPGEKLHVAKSLAALSRYSLVDLTRAESSEITAVSLHRLIQAATRRTHTSTDPCVAVLTALTLAFPAETTEPKAWPAARALEPHVLTAVDHAQEGSCSLGEASWLLDRYATYLQYSGLVQAAPPIFERAVTLYAGVATGDDPILLLRRGNLATSYWSAGRNDYAISIQEQVLADRERVSGRDHADTHFARANLASSYWAAGRNDDAITLHEQVLADRRRILGDDHPDTLLTRANLASCYWTAGRNDDAITLGEQVITDTKRILGDDHPETLHAQHNLAFPYESAGRVREAIELMEQTVEARERVLGKEHPDTILSKTTLTRWNGQGDSVGS